MIRYGLFITLVLLTGIAYAQTPADLPVVNGPLSISQAVDSALKYSPMIAVRRALADAASARLSSSKSMKQVSTVLSAGVDNSNMQMILPGVEGLGPASGTIVPDRSRGGLTLMMMYPLSTGGKLESMIKSRTADKTSSELDVKSIELDAALAAKTAYRQAVLAQLMQDTAQRWIDESTERVRIAEESFAQGRIAKFDLLRNKAELSDATAKLNSANRDFTVALIRLKSAMGVSQESSFEISDPLSDSVPDLSKDKLTEKALRERPDIQSARKMIESRNAMVKAAKAASSPQLYAVAMGQAETVQGMPFDKGYLLGLIAAMPLSDGGLRKSGVDEATAMVKEAEASLAVMELEVRAEVASGIVDVKTAAKNLLLASDAINQAEEDYKVIRLRYEAGKSTNVEVLDALASLTNARTMRAQALYELNTAQDTLQKTTGEK